MRKHTINLERKGEYEVEIFYMHAIKEKSKV